MDTDLSSDEKNRRLMEKIRNRQKEIKLKSANTSMVTASGTSDFISPDKRDKTMDQSEQSMINLNSPDPTIKGKFPGSFLKQKVHQDGPSIVIHNEDSIKRIMADESASMDLNDTTLMNMTAMSDSQNYSSAQMQKHFQQNNSQSKVIGTSAFNLAPQQMDAPSSGDASIKKLGSIGFQELSFIHKDPKNPNSFTGDSFQQFETGKTPSGMINYNDIVEEEFDLDDQEMDNSIADMSALVKKAATDAGVYTQKEDAHYDFDKISEKDEEEEEEANISSGGPGNDTSAKRHQVRGVKNVPKLKFDFLSPDEPLRMTNKSDNIKEESLQGSSLDSVDKLWQQALDMDDGENNMFLDTGEEELISTRNLEQQVEEQKQQDQEYEFEEQQNEEEQLKQLEQIKKDDAEQYQKMIKSQISFDFPSTDAANQSNVDLKHYHRYFTSQLHLAPSTDNNAKLIMNQLKQKEEGNYRIAENYQELGCIGFYGVQNNEDVLISMIILNNCSDIVEAQSNVQSASYNNIQQFLVPDLQMIALKAALKKIIQNITEDFQGEMQREGNAQLDEHIMQKADFGVLLIMGKQYFHVCKFKQAIYCLNLAQCKCKTSVRVNKRDLEEANLWLCIVRKVYLTNRIRVFRKNQDKRQGDPKYADYVKQGAMEIFDIYKNLKSAISEFEDTKDEKSKMFSVVLYIKLKVEIFRQSELYQKIIKALESEFESQYVQTGSSNDASGKDFQVDGDKSLISRNMVSNSITDEQEFSRARMNTKSNMQTFLGNTFKKGKSPKNSLAQSFMFGGPPKVEKADNSLKESIMEPDGGFVDQSKSIKNKNRKFTMRFRDRQIMTPKAGKIAEVKISAQDMAVMRKQETIRGEAYQIRTQTKQSNLQKLEAILKELSHINAYVGTVAASEVHFMRMTQIQRLASTVSMGSEVHQEVEAVDFSELQKGIQILEELITENPTKILASVKLWQFHRTQGQINSVVKDNVQDPKNEELHENFDRALQIAETLQYNFQNHKSVQDAKQQTNQDSIEAQIIVTLINVKSLYDSESYQTCFGMLQKEYLSSSKYTGFLYLYGKYVIKSNKTAKYKNTQEQKQFLGSGIGALEECLKSSMPEFHSRINYYIGLAYNRQNTILSMPLKSIHYWQEAQNLGFYSPYQGLQKMRYIKKFLDQHSFIHLIVGMINKSIDENQDLLDDKVNAQNATLAKQYLSVLDTFQEKFDGPSSLILKSHIYAYTLKRQQEAQECFKELSLKYPKVISGYLEYWDYLSKILKKKKQMMKKNYEKAKALNSLAARQQAVKDKKDALKLLSQIRTITQKALQYSNVCVHVSTSEWVRVRQMAAKTYLLQKKFNKAIQILTDLCFVIPSYMLCINNDNANLTIYDYDDEANKLDFGGIRFCNQILAEDASDEDNSEDQDEPSPGKKNKQHDQFKNMIFIDKRQEEQIRNDFQNNDDNDSDYGKKSVEDQARDEMQEMNFTSDQQSSRKAQYLKASQINEKAIYNYNDKTGVREQSDAVDQNGLFMAPMETENSNWDLSDFDAQPDRSMTGSMLSIQNPDELVRPFANRFQNPRANQNGMDLQIEIDMDMEDQSVDRRLTESDVITPKNQLIGRTAETTRAKDRKTMHGAIFSAQNPGQSHNQVDIGSKTIKFNHKKIGNARQSMLSSNSRGSKRSSYNIFHSKSKRGGLAVSRAFSSANFDIGQFNDINLMLRNKNNEVQENEDNLLQSNTIFAVNSDVYFLYMIGKMCAQSGHNLFQGLQALNDYYLLVWHNGPSSDESQQAKKSRNPLNNQSNSSSGGRIKECVKALWQIAQIYERLEQPEIAMKFYQKILEARESLNKDFGCEKYTLMAENKMGVIFSTMIGQQIPHDLGHFHQYPTRLQTEMPVAEMQRDSKIQIDLNYF